MIYFHLGAEVPVYFWTKALNFSKLELIYIYIYILLVSLWLFFLGSFFRNLEFEDEQKVHQNKQLAKLTSAHKDIVEIMTGTHNIFSGDGPEV